MVGYRIAGLVLLLFQVTDVVALCDLDAAKACVTYYPPFPVEGLPTREECRHFTAGTDSAALCINRYTINCGTEGQLDVLFAGLSLLTDLERDVQICKNVTDRCYNDSCEHNAACMEKETGPFVCLCSHEYTGATCQTKITTAAATIPTVTPDPATAAATVPTIPAPLTPPGAAGVTPDPRGNAATYTDAPSSLTLPLAVGVSVSLSVVLAIAVALTVRRCQSGAPTHGPFQETINPAYHASGHVSVISVTDTYYQEINLPDSPDGASGRPTSIY